MNRTFLIAAAAVAVLAAGCANGNDEQSPQPPTVAPGASLDAKGTLTIDGKAEDVKGTCTAPADGNGVNISLSGVTSSKVNVTVDKSTPPKVTSVVMTTSTMAFRYEPGSGGEAKATNDGNRYRITGEVQGALEAKKSYDIDVTCG